MCPFQHGLSTSEIFNKSTVSAKFTSAVEKARVIEREGNLMIFLPY